MNEEIRLKCINDKNVTEIKHHLLFLELDGFIHLCFKILVWFAIFLPLDVPEFMLDRK